MWFVLLLIIHYVLASTIDYNNVLAYKCETNTDCTNLMINSICFNKKCICQFGYKFNGHCQCLSEKNELRQRRQINYSMRMLGEECEWTNQCRQTPLDGTKVCVSRQCQCSHGYVSIDAYRCIKDFEYLSSNIIVTKPSETEPPGYGSVCSINSDCQHTNTQLECLHQTCVCIEGYVPLGKYLCYNVHGQGVPIMESSTMISTLSSAMSTVQPINNEVMKSLGKIGNTCTNGYFCRRTVFNSHCYNGKCTCIDGFTPLDLYTCSKNVIEQTTTLSTPLPADYKSLLGGHCLTKRNCHTSNAVCFSSICSCPKGYFPVDDWTCLEEPESSDEELIETTSIATTVTTTTIARRATFSTTTVFRWWPWSPSPTTRQTLVNLKNSFRVRCLLNRQCASMDQNSHCTLFGRCICNRGYQLETTHRGQRCTQKIIINEDDCD